MSSNRKLLFHPSLFKMRDSLAADSSIPKMMKISIFWNMSGNLKKSTGDGPGASKLQFCRRRRTRKHISLSFTWCEALSSIFPPGRPLRGKFPDFRLSMTLPLKFCIFCKSGSECSINPTSPICEKSIEIKGFAWCERRPEPTSHEGGTNWFRHPKMYIKHNYFNPNAFALGSIGFRETHLNLSR